MRLREIHPLIHGLVRVLPAPGVAVAAERHESWMKCAGNVLALLYPEESTAARMDAPNVEADTFSPERTHPEVVSRQDRGGRNAAIAGIKPGPSILTMPVDTNSAALTHRSIPRPIGGAADDEGSIPALTAEAIAASADHMPEEAEIPAVQSSEEGDDGHTVETAREAGASPALRPATSGKSGGVSDDASPAPTIVSRLRALNAEHPELTTRDVAERLGMTLARVQSNSTVNKIRWADAVPQRPDRHGDIKRLHAEHPEWCDDDFAAVLGVTPGYVRATAVRLGIRLASRVSRKKAAAEPVQPVAPVPAPMPRVDPERPPQTARAPIAVRPSGSGSAVIAKPMQRMPAGTRFNLRDDLGQWLHFGCENMTTDRKYAWEGSADQLLACRRRFPLAADLAERVVEKELARSVA